MPYHKCFSLALLVCLLGTTSLLFAQSQDDLSVLPDRFDAPPATLPSGCSTASVVTSENLRGSRSYIRLNTEFKTMELSHQASQAWIKAMSPSPTEGNVGVAFFHTNVQFTDAVNKFLCASFLTGLIKPSDEQETTLLTTLISVYNRMALQSIQLRTQFRLVAENAEQGKEAMPVAVADKLSAILADRKDAGGDFESVMMLSALLTVDTTDKNATKTDKVSMTCTERAELVEQANTLAASPTVDEFTRGAKLMQTFFSGHTGCN